MRVHVESFSSKDNSQVVFLQTGLRFLPFVDLVRRPADRCLVLCMVSKSPSYGFCGSGERTRGQ